MSQSLKCAVIGASGIGKQHAKWYHIEGGRVAAFLGRTPESVKRTTELLKSLFPFDGKGYCDCREMLSAEKPDLVSVCSPHHMHAEHAIAALEAGAHVLCEKPLAWLEGERHSESLSAADDMIEAARRNGRILAVNTQYAAAVPLFEEMHKRYRGPVGPPRKMFCHMESGGGNGGREYEEIWDDLISHPLSLLLKWMPEGELDPESVHCEIGRKKNVARFDYVAPSGERCAVEIILGNKKSKPFVRRFGLNNFVLDYEGRNDPSGTFKTFLSHQGHEEMFEDLMHLSIRRFMEAVRTGGEPLVTGEEGRKNLELQIALLEKSHRV